MLKDKHASNQDNLNKKKALTSIIPHLYKVVFIVVLGLILLASRKGQEIYPDTTTYYAPNQSDSEYKEGIIYKQNEAGFWAQYDTNSGTRVSDWYPADELKEEYNVNVRDESRGTLYEAETTKESSQGGDKSNTFQNTHNKDNNTNDTNTNTSFLDNQQEQNTDSSQLDTRAEQWTGTPYNNTDTNDALTQVENNTRINQAKQQVRETLHETTGELLEESEAPTNLFDKIINQMSSEMLEGLGAMVSTGVIDIGNAIVRGITSNFGPDLVTFEYVLNGGSLFNYDGSHTGNAVYEGTYSKKFANIARITGFTIALIILVISLILFFVAEPGTLKDTPLRLFIRFTIAVILIYNSTSVMGEFLNVGNNLWSGYVMSAATSSGELEDLKFTTFLPLTSGEGAAGKATDADYKEEYISQIIGTENNGYHATANGIKDIATACILGHNVGSFVLFIPLLVCLPFILLILAWPLIKNFFRFYVEIIERYLVVCLLVLLFGAAASTIVSKNSSQVMRSYLQMLASQIFLLFMNVVFMSVFVEGLIRGSWTSSIPNYIFALAYLRTCQQLDSYMARLNLSVAQTGGQTMQSLAGTIRNFAGAFAGINRAGRSAAGYIGDNMISKGNAKGGAALKALSKGGVIGGVAQVASQGGLGKAGAFEAGKNGRTVSVDRKTANNIMGDMMKNPSSATRTAFMGMDKASKLGAVNSMLAASGQNMRAKEIDTSKLASRGEIGFTGVTPDGRKVNGRITTDPGVMARSMGADGTGRPGTMGRENAGPAYRQIDAGSMGSAYLATNVSNFEQGRTFVAENGATNNIQSIGNQLGMTSVLSNAASSNLIHSDTVNHAVTTGDGGAQFFDKNDNILGSVTNINGEQSFSQTIGNLQEFSGGEGFMNAVEGAIPDVEKGSVMIDNVDQETGRITGTATQIDDYSNKKQVQFVAFDAAVNPSRMQSGTAINAGMGQNLSLRWKDADPVRTKASQRGNRSGGGSSKGGTKK